MAHTPPLGPPIMKNHKIRILQKKPESSLCEALKTFTTGWQNNTVVVKCVLEVLADFNQ